MAILFLVLKPVGKTMYFFKWIFSSKLWYIEGLHFCLQCLDWSAERETTPTTPRGRLTLLVREILSRWVLGVVCPKTCHMLGSRDSSLSARAGAAAFPPCEGGVVPASGNLDLTCPTSPCLNITHQAIRTLHSTQRVSLQIIIFKKNMILIILSVFTLYQCSWSLTKNIIITNIYYRTLSIRDDLSVKFKVTTGLKVIQSYLPSFNTIIQSS